MKKFFESIRNKFGKAVTTVKATVESTTGEGYIDTGVKIIIGVVVGGVILAGGDVPASPPHLSERRKAMYMNPTIPIVTPVLQPLVETFVKENVIAKDAVRLILMIVLVTAISATVGFLLHKRMKK